jgi:hypothetical protein
MRRLWILLMLFLFLGCTTLPTSRMEEKVKILEERVDEMEMVVAAGAGAYFRPFSGGLDGTGAGALQKVTGTNDGDVGLVVLENYTGGAGEGPLASAAVGNIWFTYVLDDSSACGSDDWPYVGTAQDGVNECWEYAGLYQVKTEFIPIGWAIDGSSPPALLETITSTNKVKVRKFDGSVGDEDVQINWAVPTDFLTGYGKIKFRVITMVTESAPTTQGWSFFLQGASVGSDDALNATLYTPVESNIIDISNAQYDFAYTNWSSEVTITNLTAGEFALLKLYRDISDEDDDYGQDVGVIGILVMYPAKMTAEW